MSTSDLSMRTPLQEKLLKAGLVKKHNVDAAVREQAKQRQGKAPATPNPEQVNAQKLQAERAERDRALAAERNAQARAKELLAQIRQIIDSHKIRFEGEITYRFVDDGKVKNVFVNDKLRGQLAAGTLVIVPFDQGYALLPRAAAEMVYARGGTVVLDHTRTASTEAAADSDDEHYRKFVVPDDLVW